MTAQQEDCLFMVRHHVVMGLPFPQALIDAAAALGVAVITGGPTRFEVNIAPEFEVAWRGLINDERNAQLENDIEVSGSTPPASGIN